MGGRCTSRRVGQEVVAFPSYRPVCLDQCVPVRGMAGIGGDFQHLEYGEGGQGQVSLAVGGCCPGGVCEQVHGQWFHPVGLGLSQILACCSAAGRLGHRGPDPIDVEGIAPGDDRLQGRGEVGPGDQLADCRGMPFWKHRRGRRLGSETDRVPGPCSREFRRGRESFRGKSDGWFQHL